MFLVWMIQSNTTMTMTLRLFLTEIFGSKSKLIILMSSIMFYLGKIRQTFTNLKNVLNT